jgi:RNA polymerase sigma-70 factor, ECF subfamily
MESESMVLIVGADQSRGADGMISYISKTTSCIRFEGLCALHRPDVLRFALWLARDHAIAEDVVQETFVRAWRAIESLSDPEAARAWLMAIARREHARLYERKQFSMISLDDLVASDAAELASAPSEDFSDVGAAISALEPDYRKPLVLQALMGYSTSEIARLMGLTPTAVLSRLHRARQKLRLALSTMECAAEGFATRSAQGRRNNAFAASN